MRFASCFSGIEAPSAAWLPLGWNCIWVAEIEPFPCAVLAAHYPAVPNLGDVAAPDFLQRAKAMGPVDVLVGGPPCQDFSIAGQRASLGGQRGQMSLRWVEIIDAVQPIYSVTENVPGWLNTPDNAFGCFLGALVGADAPLVPPAGLRWTDAGMVVGPKRSAAWRTLDAQHFGLAQRRERVFVVASAGDPAYPAEILFECAGVHGNFAPRRQERKNVAGTLSVRTHGGGGLGTDFDLDGGLHVAPTLDGRSGRSGANSFATSGGLIAHALTGHAVKGGGHSKSHPNAGVMPVIAFDTTQITSKANRSNPQPSDPCHPLAAGAHPPAIAFRACGQDGFAPQNISPPLTSTDGGGTVPTVGSANMAVRRLSVIECDRLQGFPDGFTHIEYGSRRKIAADEAEYLLSHNLACEQLDGQWYTRIAADGPQYKALGNSMAVPVLRWIGERILQSQEVLA